MVQSLLSGDDSIGEAAPAYGEAPRKGGASQSASTQTDDIIVRAHRTETRRAREAQELEPVLRALEAVDGIGEGAASYLRQRRVRLGFTPQRGSGARWFDWRTLRRGIFLNASYGLDRLAIPQLAALIVHEVVHLRQGPREALSVRGELVAWQTQRAVLDQMSGPVRDPRWRRIQGLDSRSRDDLRRARQLMKDLGGPGYHIELLPLLPATAEVGRVVRRLVRRIGAMACAKRTRASLPPSEDGSR